MSLTTDIEDIVARAKTYEKTASASAKQLSCSATIGTLRSVGALLRDSDGDVAHTKKIACEDVARVLGK